MNSKATATSERQDNKSTAQPAPNNVPAKTDQAKPADRGVPAIVQMKAYLDERMGELQFALPPHISPERFQRVALTALQRKPELLKCTKQSLWNACLLAAQDGLMPDGREGAIVPYGENQDGKRTKEIATWMPMIEGFRKKARNSGEIANWEVHVVFAQDHFRYALGDEAFIEHEPYFGPGDAGPVVGAYSIATMKDGTKSREVMTIKQIKLIEAKSKAGNGPWKDATFFPEMCRKTVARRHYKQLPHSSDLDDMIRHDDEAFGLDERSESQIENRQQQRVGSTAATFNRFAGGGSQSFIEHDAGEDGAASQDTGTTDDEFADDEADAGTDGGQGGDGGKEVGQGSEAGKTTATDTKTNATAGDANAAAGGKQEPAGQTQTDQTTDAGSAEDQSNDEHRWPAGATPKDADEYEFYANTKIGDFNHQSKLTIAGRDYAGVDCIAPWWKSLDELSLRKTCKVSKEMHDRIRDAAVARATGLRAKA